MTDFDPVVAAALERVVPAQAAPGGDWADVLGRAQRSGRSRRTRRRKMLAVAAAVALTIASGAQAGVLGRAARAFIDVLSPASPPAAQIIAQAGHRFDAELRAMARAFPSKVSGSAPTFRLTPARRVTTIATERGDVVWNAAVDRSGRGFCQVAVRRGLSLGGDCQVRDAHGYAVSVATSGDTPGRIVVTGLAPHEVAAITITRQDGGSRQARRLGSFFFGTLKGGEPITITETSTGGGVLRRARFSDPACTDGVSEVGGRALLPGAGFTYCTQGGVITRFPASRALIPVCPASGCGLPTIENNREAVAPPPPNRASTPANALTTIRTRLRTTLIRSARLGEPPAVAGTGRPWLYVGLGHAHGATGVLGQFYAELLAATYVVQAPRAGLPQIGGLVGFAAAAPACRESPTAARCPTPYGYGRISLPPGARSGTTPSAASLDADIRLGLAQAHLEPISVRFVKPLESLAPIVVARPTNSGPIDVGRQWETIFGATGTVQAAYLEVVDSHGRPVSATAMIDILGSGISWHRTAPR